MQVVTEGDYKPHKNDDGALLVTISSDNRDELEGTDPKWMAIEEGKRQLMPNPGLTLSGGVFSLKSEGKGKDLKQIFGRTYKLTAGLPGF